MEKIIVDGYNVIHRVPELQRLLDRGLEEARAELILQIKSMLTWKRVEVVLVFDGNHMGGPAQPVTGHDRLRVVFSRAPVKADPVMQSLIKGEDRPARVTLVSDDQEMVSFARSMGARTLSAQGFYDRLHRRLRGEDLNRKFDYDISADELEEWIDLFSRDDGDEE